MNSSLSSVLSRIQNYETEKKPWLRDKKLTSYLTSLESGKPHSNFSKVITNLATFKDLESFLFSYSIPFVGFLKSPLFPIFTDKLKNSNGDFASLVNFLVRHLASLDHLLHCHDIFLDLSDDIYFQVDVNGRKPNASFSLDLQFSKDTITISFPAMKRPRLRLILNHFWLYILISAKYHQ